MSKIGVSAGTAGVLGLREIAAEALPTTAYLIVGGKCSSDCGFCSRARSSHARADHLSRITWPEYAAEETLDRVIAAYDSGGIRRCCFQTTVSAGYMEQLVDLVREVGGRLPVCASVVPSGLSDVQRLLEAGAQRVGLSLDAASERVYREVKGGSWQATMGLIGEAALRFPGRITTHLIAGLGETEREMVEALQQMEDIGVEVGLFAFTPVRGTRLESLPPPPLAAYRRVQTSHFLIKKRISSAGLFSFDGLERIAGFGLSRRRLQRVLADGEAFRTSGCEGCNRPFYNERPGSVMYNYPRPLTAEEAMAAIREVLSPPPGAEPCG